MTIPTNENEHIEVHFQETDGDEGVFVKQKGGIK
jgi:pyrimidine operon attenuation protein/uracil phosphoribosyltransferase